MNKITIALVVGVVVIAGGGYYMYTNSGSGTEGPGVEQGEVNQAAGGTLASLIARGQNLECTFEHNDGANISSGTVYLANGAKRIRGDFSIQQSGAGPMEAHMVRDGGYNYIWGSFYPQGIKSKVTAEEEGKLFSAKNGGGIDEDTTFDCKPWNVDGGKFSRPTNIEFMEINVQAGQMDSGKTINDLEAIKKQQCDTRVCDQAPEGIPRQQCLQALGCN